MASSSLIQHYNLHQQQEVETRDWLPAGPIIVGVTAGASCPNNLIEDVIRHLFKFRGISVQELLAVIRRFCPRLRVVFMSGKDELRHAVLQAGADVFAYKADPPENLLRLIRELVAEKVNQHIAS